MKPEIKKQWVAALRSGEYKQGFCKLRLKDTSGNYTFCCLGVLTDLYLKEKGLEWENTATEITPIKPGRVTMVLNYANFAALPLSIIEWSGLNTCGILPNAGKVIIGKKPLVSLMSINDSQKFDFNQIADIIEEHI